MSKSKGPHPVIKDRNSREVIKLVGKKKSPPTPEKKIGKEKINNYIGNTKFNRMN